MDLYPVAVCYSARQDNTVQYSTIHYITQNNIQHSRQHSACKITKKSRPPQSNIGIRCTLKDIFTLFLKDDRRT